MLFNSRVLFYAMRVLICTIFDFCFFCYSSVFIFHFASNVGSRKLSYSFFLCLVVCGNRCIYGESCNIGV